MGINVHMNKRRLASAVALMGAAALTVTTVVMAAGPSGGGGGGGGAPGGQIEAIEKVESVISVNLVAPTIGSMARNTEFIGKIEAADSVSVYPAASGKIAEIYFEAGQQVKEGDLLMRLETDDLEFDLTVAEASYNEKVLSANKTLGSDYTSKIIAAQNTLDKANRSYRTARQNYASEANIEDDELEKADNKRIAAKTAREEALVVWNQAQTAYQEQSGSTTGMEDDPTVKAAHAAYTEAYEKYTDADNDYYNLTEEYDDSTSTAVASKDNAYKDVTQAKESLELATGAAFAEQQAIIEAGLVSAQYALQKAERAIDKTYVYAPIGGVIETRAATVYETASPNTAAFTISNNDAVMVKFNASSDGAAALALGDTVTVTKSGTEYTALIVEIDTKANATTGLFPIKASLTGDHTLLSGISVKVSAATAKAENALMIPIDTVYYDEGQAYVFTYQDGKAYRSDIETGMADAQTTVVSSGLDENSKIITTWHPDMANDVTVQLTEQAAALLGQTSGAGKATIAPDALDQPADDEATIAPDELDQDADKENQAAANTDEKINAPSGEPADASQPAEAPPAETKDGGNTTT